MIKWNVQFMFNNKHIFFSFVYFYRKPDASKRQIRQTPDWSENAVAGDHLWVPTSVSGDFCYVGDNECTVSTFFFKKILLFPIVEENYSVYHDSIGTYSEHKKK